MFRKIKNFIVGSRLRNKFLLFFVILATTPVLVLGGVALFLIDVSHKQDVSTLELQLLGERIEEIEKFFANTLGILELRVGYTQRSEIEPTQQIFLLEGLLEENGAFEEVSFVTLDGMESAKKIRGQEEAQLQNVSLLPKFIVPVEGRDYVSEVYYTLRGPFVTLSAPVRNRNDDIVQVLSAEVNLSPVTRSIETALLGSSGYLVLVDQNGSLITQGFGSVQPGINLLHFERVKRVLKGERLDGLGKRDRYVSILGDTSVVGAGNYLTGIGWALFAEWPIEDADAIIEDIRRQIIQLSLISIFAVLLLAPLFAHRLVQPIHVLEREAAAISKGDFGKRVIIKTGDELEDLGTAFNRMIKGLARLKELQDEFVFIAAHELKSPVSVIKGYVSMIMEGSAGPVSGQMKEMLVYINKANEGLQKLVQDLLQVARSEAGRIEIEVFSFDIRMAIDTVIGEIKTLADKKQITISYERPEKILLILSDTSRFKEVMTNLISNAIKYNHNGGWIKITHEIDGDHVVTHVADNGFGVPQERQKHIFEKFYRAKTKGTEEVQGTGLGLFIIKELVQKMQGDIWFKSTEGKGTTFSFKFKKGK